MGRTLKGIATGTAAVLLLAGCRPGSDRYRTFADFPGFASYYARRCAGGDPGPPTMGDRELLRRFRPRFNLAPGSIRPISFYRDYLPHAVLRRFSDKAVVEETVSPEELRRQQDNTEVYLEYRPASGVKEIPVVFGRVYRERVPFPGERGGETRHLDLTFLKYNLVFPESGLPAGLNHLAGWILKGVGLDPRDWHQLDNFVAAHIVLDGGGNPIAVLLAQHNHHRAYLVRRDIVFPADGRFVFDVALRSNELYPGSDSESPVRHRVVRWSLYLKYLLGGEGRPLASADDITYGRRAGGREVAYDLGFPSPCDPFYTAKIMLGAPRPFFGFDIGRDGPPGSDYYTVPDLLPLGNLLKFSYLHDGDPDDLRVVGESIDERRGTTDISRIMAHGGKKFFGDYLAYFGANGSTR
ncbi:hypothetical protein K0B90_03070 [bacterium]|nr:hypothetical protein [bacterium]